MDRRWPTVSCTRERMRKIASLRETSRAFSTAATSSVFATSRKWFMRSMSELIDSSSVTSKATIRRYSLWPSRTRSRMKSRVSSGDISRRMPSGRTASEPPSALFAISSRSSHTPRVSARSPAKPSAVRHERIDSFMKRMRPSSSAQMTPSGSARMESMIDKRETERRPARTSRVSAAPTRKTKNAASPMRRYGTR